MKSKQSQGDRGRQLEAVHIQSPSKSLVSLGPPAMMGGEHVEVSTDRGQRVVEEQVDVRPSSKQEHGRNAQQEMLPRVVVKQPKQSADRINNTHNTTRSEIDELLQLTNRTNRASVGQGASGAGECSLGARVAVSQSIPSWTVNVRHIETAEHQQRSKLKKLQHKPGTNTTGGLYASYGQQRLGAARQLQTDRQSEFTNNQTSNNNQLSKSTHFRSSSNVITGPGGNPKSYQTSRVLADKGRRIQNMHSIQPIDEPISSYEYPVVAGGSGAWAGQHKLNASFSSTIGTPRATLDHRLKNIRDIKDIKNQNFERSRLAIQRIHQQLEVSKVMRGHSYQLSNINGFLHQGIKDKFLQHPVHKQLTQDLASLNEATLELQDQVKCYKLDLAQSLQCLFECYTCIFVKQYETFYKTENEKERRIERKFQEIQEQKARQDEWEAELKQKQEMIKNLIYCKDREIAQLKLSDVQQSQQIECLNKILEEPWRAESKKPKAPPKDGDDEQERRDSSMLTNRQYEQLLNTFTHEANSKKNVEDLNQVLDQFYDQNMKRRERALFEIHQTVGAMMNASKQDQASQTEESMTKAYLSDAKGEPDAFGNGNDGTGEANGFGKKRKFVNRNKQPSEGMQKYQRIQADLRSGSPSAASAGPCQAVDDESADEHKKELNKSYRSTTAQVPVFQLPAEHPMGMYGRTKKQLLLADQEHTATLGSILNQRFDLLLKQEIDQSQARGSKSTWRTQIPETAETLRWGLPAHVITFLASKIERIQRDGVLDAKLKIQQWPQFKKELFDIIDHRIEYAAEINGAINTSYMSLDEHLIVYMIHKFDPVVVAKATRGLNGTRDEVQNQLLEFLLNLKYYSTRWLRAKQYAQMLGFLAKKDAVSVASGVADHDLDDIEIPGTDIYLQEFFMYAYSFITKDRKHFFESTEGKTYIKQQSEIKQSKKVHDLIYGDLAKDIEYWQKRITANVHKIKVNELDDAETEFIELDLVLDFYLEDYRKLRRANQKKIRAAIQEMNKNNQTLAKEISLQDVQRILKGIIPVKTPAPNVHFAKDITIIRAFVYSLVCEDNCNAISAEAFLAGCNRYGIDNPCPIITKRIGLYGLTEDLEKDFKRLVERYRKENPAIRIDPDVYGQAELKEGFVFEPGYSKKTAKQTWDFKETSIKSPAKKSAGIQNLALLTPTTFANLGRKHDIGQEFTSNEEVDPMKEKPEQPQQPTKDHYVGGVKMNIVDIKHLHRADPELAQPSRGKHGKGGRRGQQEAVPEPSHTERARRALAPKMFEGLSPAAHHAYAERGTELTQCEFGIGDRKIIIPSFQTTGKLFAQHFQILRELQHRVQLLRKAKDKQRSEDQSWYQIDEILAVLANALKFLSFPDSDIDQRMVPAVRGSPGGDKLSVFVQ